MKRGAILLAMGLAACGARSGLDVPPECDEDADCAEPRDRCEGSAACERGACAIRPWTEPPARELCTGGEDEDCDRRIDCSDTDCAGDEACEGCAPEVCADGVDDDCDAQIDCADRDCAGSELCCTPSPETCDGEDDDCDGAIDDGRTCYSLDGAPIDAIATDRCGAEWYSYDMPDTASASPAPDLRRSGAVAVAIVESPDACGGAAVAVIADRVRDGSGGMLSATFSIDPAGIGGILVGDEPDECALDRASGEGGCRWVWQPCCTDGILIGPLGDDFCVELTLADPAGVSALAVWDGTAPIDREFGAPMRLCARTLPDVP